MRRSFERGAKTILSRTGSSGMLVISIIATSSSRSSRTPAREPAGALATDSVSSTVSSVVISRTTGMSFMLGGRERGYESWGLVHLRIVPSGQDRSCTGLEGDPHPRLAADTVWVGITDRGNRGTDDGLCDSAPNICGVGSMNAKDASPFRTVSVGREHPLQLLRCRVRFGGPGKRLSDCRDWRFGRHSGAGYSWTPRELERSVHPQSCSTADLYRSDRRHDCEARACSGATLPRLPARRDARATGGGERRLRGTRGFAALRCLWQRVRPASRRA